jgi:hypothetical protein
MVEIENAGLEADDAAAAAVQKTPNRVTLDDLKAKIVEVSYFNPAHSPHVTVAVALTENGFNVVGMSAPADPGNFDAKLGRDIALKQCIEQLWPLEGYLLRQRLYDAEIRKAQFEQVNTAL